MGTKAQLAVFLIVGLIVLGIILFAQVLENHLLGKAPLHSTLLPDPQAAMKAYVQSCLEETGSDAIYYVLLQGGHYYPPSQSTPLYGMQVAHYWENKINLMPSKQELEQQISYYIGENLHECLQGFRAFRTFGWDISAQSLLVEPDDPSYAFAATQELLESIEQHEFGLTPKQYPISATIGKDSLLLRMDSPIEIRTGNGLAVVDEFHSDLPSNLLKIYSIASMFMDEQTLNPDVIPLGALSHLAEENDFDYEIVHLEDKTVLFGFIFPEDPELIYSFINKYDSGDNS